MTPAYREAMSLAISALEDARTKIAAEMRDYPTPISGCDAQFNHLLAERQRIAAALNALSESVFVATPRSLAPEVGVESR